MKVVKKYYWFIVGFMLVFASCNKTISAVNGNSTDRENPFEDAYYLNIQGTEQRLAHLMIGTFVCHSVNKEGT